jgi:hypothetical protein
MRSLRLSLLTLLTLVACEGDPLAPTCPAVTDTTPVAPEAPFFTEATAEAGLDDGYLVAGRSVVVDFDGDGWDDLVTLPVDDATSMSPTFARNLGPGDGGRPRFEDWTAESGMAAASMALLVFADVDDDGDQDAFAGFSARAARVGGARAEIWLNDGTGRFLRRDDAGIDRVTVDVGGTLYQEEHAAATFADFDGDGHLDLYIGAWRVGRVNAEDGIDNLLLATPDELYLGDGEGGFARVELPDQRNPLTATVAPDFAALPRPAYGVAPADFDGDGDMDLFVNNYGAGRPALGSAPLYLEHNLLWRNDSTPGNIAFVDVGVSAGVHATRRGIGGVENEESFVFDGVTYTGPVGGNGFGCEWGDIDGDGDLDLVVGSIAHPDYPQSDRTMLHINQGDGTFTEESAIRDLEYYEDELHPVLVDIDQDGRLDLAMSRLRGGTKWRMYFQRPDGSFSLQTVPGSGVDIERPGNTVWADFDHDGDLDFFMARVAGGRLFLNQVGQENHSVALRLEATAPRDATGAMVFADGPDGRTITRQLISGGGHYNSQHSRELNLGFGREATLRNVRVRWPDGEEQAIGDRCPGERLRVVQGEAPTRL